MAGTNTAAAAEGADAEGTVAEGTVAEGADTRSPSLVVDSQDAEAEAPHIQDAFHRSWQRG